MVWVNCLVEEVLLVGDIVEFVGFIVLCWEVVYGVENSCVDFCLEYFMGVLFIEVKSVILGFDEIVVVVFFDVVMLCGVKYLCELVVLVWEGICVV